MLISPGIEPHGPSVYGGRNLTDELTVTRGFGSFGNDPRKDYALEPYYQFGEPRTLGATVSYQFGG